MPEGLARDISTQSIPWTQEDDEVINLAQTIYEPIVEDVRPKGAVMVRRSLLRSSNWRSVRPRRKSARRSQLVASDHASRYAMPKVPWTMTVTTRTGKKSSAVVRLVFSFFCFYKKWIFFISINLCLVARNDSARTVSSNHAR